MEWKNKMRVIVCGRNYSSNLCMARSFGQAGYDVEVLRVFQRKPQKKNLLAFLKPDAHSKYVKAYHVCISYGENARIVEKLIAMGNEKQKSLLIPVDDLVVAAADDAYDVLSKYYVIPNIHQKAGEITRLMSKDLQKELAKKAGLPVLNSCLLQTHNGMFEIPAEVNYPCFIKPNISKNSTKNKMKKCSSEEELRETLKKFSQSEDIEMLVEDYAEIAEEYSLLGLSTREGVAAPAFFKVVEGGQNDSQGVALIGKILDCSEKRHVQEKMIRFVESLNYEGLFDIDLIETVDGKIYFVELNLRYGASGYAVTESGVNLPGMLADYMLKGKPIHRNCQLTETGKLFISEKMLLEDYAKRRFCLAEIKNKMQKADIYFIKNEIDMEPYRHFRRFYLLAALARIYFRITSAY